MEILYKAISNQIVNYCMSHVNLQTLLEDDAEDAIKILQKCVVCCQTYKRIYNKVCGNI